MENEVYVFAVTAVNQVGESSVNSTTMIQTNESSEYQIHMYNSIAHVHFLL